METTETTRRGDAPFHAAKALQIPGPSPSAFLGWRGNQFRFGLDPLAYLTALRKEYGEVAALARGGNGNIITPAAAARARWQPLARSPTRPS